MSTELATNLETADLTLTVRLDHTIESLANLFESLANLNGSLTSILDRIQGGAADPKTGPEPIKDSIQQRTNEIDELLSRSLVMTENILRQL